MIITRPRRHRLAAGLCALGTLIVLVVGTLVPAAPLAQSAPTAPTGLMAIALDGQVGLAWKPVAGATSYQVYRGTSAASITQQVSPAGLAATTFTDATAANGTTYFY